LEQSQIDTGVFPGYSTIAVQITRSDDVFSEQYMQFLEISTSVPERIDIPLITTVEIVNFSNLLFYREGFNQPFAAGYMMKSNIENHIELIHGRVPLPGISPETGIREVMVTEPMLIRNMLTLDGIYTISVPALHDAYSEAVQIVGVFEPIAGDPYWQSGTYANTLFLPFESLEGFRDHQFVRNMRVTHIHIFDYHQIKVAQVNDINTALGDLRRDMENTFGRAMSPLRCSFEPTIIRYVAREENLRYLLQLLYIPIIIMILYYVFMVARLKIMSEEPVIAVLRSRGASGRNILLIYFLEVLIMGIIALLIGIPLGWVMCRIIGSSNGFLDFVSRTALPLEMNAQVYIYAAIAFLAIVLTTITPVLKYSRTSIVVQKQKAARPKQPLWKRLYLDILLFGLSIYYLYMMRAQTGFLSEIGLAGTDSNIDMTIYLASTVFAIGTGLCFLRLYPFLVSLIYKIGRRYWSPVVFAALHTIKGSSGAESFLMLFIILSLSIGLFNAGAARTINRNIEDRIKNDFGADIITRQRWQELDAFGQPVVEFEGPGGPVRTETVSYIEPPFVDFRMLDGVRGVARVLQQDNVRVRFSGKASTASFMAFDPYDFANTAWWRADLTPYDFYDYMIKMAEYPSSVILSESLRDILGLREGDRIRIDSLANNTIIEFDILAFVDHWPAFSPFSRDSSGAMVSNNMIAANLEYVFYHTPSFPYDVWIRKAPGISDEVIYDQIAEVSTPFMRIDTITKPMVEAKNDPVVQGTNGALSLGFIIAMIISGMGFLIYWILSINSRVLQFGVFRAMGMTRKKVLTIIICEQFLVSGVALIAGVVIGNVAVSLFVPIFRLLYSGEDQSIPFRIFLSGNDSIRVYTIFALVIIFCLLILGHILRRLKVDQALKLGED